MKKAKGFSLIELLLVVSALGILGYSIAHFLNTSTKTGKSMSETLEIKDAGMTAESILRTDLKLAGHSFSLLELPDDNGNSFFTLNSDEICIANCTRAMTLKAEGLSLVLALENPFLVKAISFAPGSFYSLATANSSSESAKLNFEDSKLNDFLGETSGYKNENQVLRFYTPVYINHRMPSFVGIVKSGKVVPITFTGLSAQINPINNLEYFSLDLFFKTMPSIGGAGAMGLVAPLKIVKYEIKKILKGNGLFRSVFDGNSFNNSTLIAAQVKNVLFKRETIASKSVSFGINQE